MATALGILHNIFRKIIMRKTLSMVTRSLLNDLSREISLFLDLDLDLDLNLNLVRWLSRQIWSKIQCEKKTIQVMQFRGHILEAIWRWTGIWIWIWASGCPDTFIQISMWNTWYHPTWFKANKQKIYIGGLLGHQNQWQWTKSWKDMLKSGDVFFGPQKKRAGGHLAAKSL